MQMERIGLGRATERGADGGGSGDFKTARCRWGFAIHAIHGLIICEGLRGGEVVGQHVEEDVMVQQ